MEKRDFQPESRLPRPLYNQVISCRYLPKKKMSRLCGALSLRPSTQVHVADKNMGPQESNRRPHNIPCVCFTGSSLNTRCTIGTFDFFFIFIVCLTGNPTTWQHRDGRVMNLRRAARRRCCMLHIFFFNSQYIVETCISWSY